MDNQSLASELLREIKNSAKRWFYAFIVMAALEVITIGVFFWYISLPTDVTTTQVSNQSGDLNYIGNDGDITTNEQYNNNYYTPSDTGTPTQ